MTEFDLHASRRDMLIGSGSLGLASALASVARGTTNGGKDAPAVAPTSANPGVSPVDRAFVRIAEGPVHYRFMGKHGQGSLPPLLMAHPGPGSSEAFADQIPELSKSRFVFAPDMLGNGDSPPPAHLETDIPYYVDATIRVMDALKVERVDFFGAHTGAQIGVEMAVRHPDRIRRLGLDGIPLFPPEFRMELLERYAPPVKPDAWGGHFAWAWSHARESTLYWPHYLQDATHRLSNTYRTPEQLHASAMTVLKVLSTYHIAFNAAFRQDVHALLPRIVHPTMVMSIERDPLHVYLEEAATLIKNSTRIMIETGAGVNGKTAAIKEFFET